MPSRQVNFAIIAETPDLLVVDKPAGILVHPTKPNGPVTLRDSLCELLAYEIANGGQVSIINRLDRETSGLTLIAKSAAAARACAISMQSGGIAKEYRAIVTGWPREEAFTVDAPLLRLGEVAPSAIWLKRAVHPDGAPSCTHFRVLKRWCHPEAGALALVAAQPITGRTHQIRVHLSHAGFPVLGDKIYGPDEQWYLRFVQGGWSDDLQAALFLPRHALHSTGIKFTYQGEQYDWSSSMPQDMQAVIDRGSL